jgi:hypothetical protein
MASECISYNLEFQNIPGEDPCTPAYQKGENSPLVLCPTVAAGEKTRLYKAIFQATFMTKSASEYLFCMKN